MARADLGKCISFSWNLIFSCNYRCPYCWFHGKWQHLAINNRIFSPKEIIDAWEIIFKRYGSVHINILGGEPFLYPHFKEIIKVISNFHRVNISTNLSSDIKRFIEGINPLNVKIMPTFHPLFADLDIFLKKLLIMKDNGFDWGASLLAYPPHLKLWEYYREKFVSAFLCLGLIPFWGKYNDIEYPQGYTNEEKQLIKSTEREGGEGLFQLIPKKIERGSLCRAGQIYADIQSDGKIQRCGMDPTEGSLGNFFDGSFEFLDKPIPCNAEQCPCNLWTFLLIEKDDSVSAQIFAEPKSTEISTVSVKNQSRLVDLEEDSRQPRFPRLDPPYKVYWNWEITYECNYQCSYCHFWKIEKKYPYIHIERWLGIWKNIFNKYGCCHIRFSGGEPTIYPNFLNLIAVLSQMHTIDITTNLTFDINCLIEKINPAALFISPSFHPEFDNINEFLEKVRNLRQQGFQVSGIAYVAYPPYLQNLKEFMEITERNNIEFKIIPFNGVFEGRVFPKDYNDAEKRLLEEAVENSLNKELNSRWLRWHVDKKESNNEGEKNEESLRLCRMGQMYARILPDGKVTRCCAENGDLGSIFNDDFKLLDEPVLCKVRVEKCPCFKAMIVGKEESWLPYWGTPRHPVYKK